MRLLRGSRLDVQIWKGECCHCESVYEATRSELDNILTPNVHDYRNGEEEYALEKCTECDMGHLSTVRMLQVPFHTIIVPPLTGDEECST